ncbi:MAG TPA: CocE/NonD family hydrolase, partial [Kineobactrum sp.]
GSLRDSAQQETGGEAPFLEFVFDPRDPVPTVGGALTSGEPVMQGGAFDQRSCAGKFGFDDSAESVALAARDDVLVFQTDELADDVVITGTIEVELWISSDQPDTDFTVKLIDVYPPSEDYPDGYAMNITDGIFRVRYRHGFDREVMMAPGEICKITIEPFATSNRFCRGHRLRIDVSSSNFPHFDVNPNTGAPQGQAGESRVARNRVYCGARYASALRVGVESP